MNTLADRYYRDECNHSISRSDRNLSVTPYIETLVDRVWNQTIYRFPDMSAIAVRFDHSELKVIKEWAA